MQLMQRFRLIMGIGILGIHLISLTVESDEVQPKIVEPKIIEPKIVEPKTPEAKEDTTEQEPKAIEPKIVEPKIIEPKVIEPKVVEPKISEPKVIEPKVVEPKASDVISVVPVVPKTPVSPIMTHDVAAKESSSAKDSLIATSKSVSASSSIQISDVHGDATHDFDTLNIDSGGNWLEKRIWYEKSEQLFEVIRASVQKVTDLRMEFVRSVNKVGHEIDGFYQTFGFQKGEIDEMLTMVDAALQNQQQVRGGDLSSSERSLKEKVQQEKNAFEAIGQQLKMIDDLDEQIDKTMMKAFKEIDTCRGFETRAWNNFKEIGLELDDKKARVLYYEMENFHKNIDQKLHYLQSNLLSYLTDQLIDKVGSTINQIKSQASTLTSKGLDLNKILEKDEKGDLLILKERELAKAEAQAAKEKMKKPKKSESFFDTFLSWLEVVISKIQDAVNVIVCCFQCIICKIHGWICGLLGYK